MYMENDIIKHTIFPYIGELKTDMPANAVTSRH